MTDDYIDHLQARIDEVEGMLLHQNVDLNLQMEGLEAENAELRQQLRAPDANYDEAMAVATDFEAAMHKAQGQVAALRVTLEQIGDIDLGRLAALDENGWCSRCVQIQTLVSAALPPVGREE